MWFVLNSFPPSVARSTIYSTVVAAASNKVLAFDVALCVATVVAPE